MSKLDKIAERLKNHLDTILRIVLEKSDKLEEENKIYRQEILRLEKVQKDLIEVISSKMSKVKK